MGHFFLEKTMSELRKTELEDVTNFVSCLI